MPISVDQLSIVKRAVEAAEKNAPAIQALAKSARIFSGLNTQFLRFADDIYRAMNAIRDVQKTFQPYRQLNLVLSYPYYYEKIPPFYQYETFWTSFSQPPLGYFPSTVSNGEANRENSWIPQFYPQKAKPKKTISGKNKTTIKTFPAQGKFWAKARYFFIKESRESLEKFWKDLKEDNQNLKSSGCSKPFILISFGFKVLTKFWVFLLGCGIITFLKNFK